MTRPTASLPHPSADLLEAGQTSRAIAREWYMKLSQIVDLIPVVGQATPASSATVAVTFAVPEISTAYMVLVEAPANALPWVTSKTVTGFTLNFPGATGATYNWTLVRY